MKLSDYRGKIVALYFCSAIQLSADGTNKPAMVTEGVRKVAERHANDPFVLLGVTTVIPSRHPDREAFRSLLNADYRGGKSTNTLGLVRTRRRK